MHSRCVKCPLHDMQSCDIYNYVDYKDDSLHLLVSITGCNVNISFLSMRKDGPKVVEK